MDWKETAKWMGVMVASGVITAVAIELVTKKLQEMAILSAKAELQNLMVAAAKEKTAKSKPPPPGMVTENDSTHFVFDNSGIGYNQLL